MNTQDNVINFSILFSLSGSARLQSSVTEDSGGLYASLDEYNSHFWLSSKMTDDSSILTYQI